MEALIGKTVKIVRDGERFWVSNVKKMDGRLFGNVANNLVVAPYQHGERIEIEESEIIDIWEEKPQDFGD